jgi:hypothetical protein
MQQSRSNRNYADAINELAADIYTDNREVGWWDESERMVGHVRQLGRHVVPDTHMIPTKIALMHSELSEALEGFRKNLPDTHLPHRPMIEV